MRVRQRQSKTEAEIDRYRQRQTDGRIKHTVRVAAIAATCYRVCHCNKGWSFREHVSFLSAMITAVY